MAKQCLDIKQMQHLQKLGLKLKDTMLYWIKPLDVVIGIVVGLKDDWRLGFIDDKKKKYLEHIPAYTLLDVLDALPKEIKYGEKICWLSFELADEMIGYYCQDYLFRPEWVYYEQVRVIDENIIDATYKLLCWAIEQGYVESNKNE